MWRTEYSARPLRSFDMRSKLLYPSHYLATFGRGKDNKKRKSRRGLLLGAGLVGGAALLGGGLLFRGRLRGRNSFIQKMPPKDISKRARNSQRVRENTELLADDILRYKQSKQALRKAQRLEIEDPIHKESHASTRRWELSRVENDRKKMRLKARKL